MAGLALPDKPNLGSLGKRTNNHTIAIVPGNLDDTYMSSAHDLSAVLDDGDNFRILPVVGEGGGQNIRNVRASALPDERERPFQELKWNAARGHRQEGINRA